MKGKFLNSTLAGVILAISCLVNLANAGIITVGDASFEDSPLNHGSWGDMVGPWSGGWVDTYPGGYSLDILAHDGEQVASGNTYQLLDVLFEAGQDYSLTAWFTPRDAGWGHGPAGFYMEDIGHNNGATLLDGFSSSPLFGGPQHGVWTEFTINYTATGADAGKKIGIYLGSAYWDDISLTTTANTNSAPSSVPEPSTLAIFALGLMGVASRRFKKQS